VIWSVETDLRPTLSTGEVKYETLPFRGANQLAKLGGAIGFDENLRAIPLAIAAK